MYGDYLRTCSCAIEEAEDGREALAKAISQKPELVVTETRLAGINGYELCEFLRRDEATRGAAIVFVTGDAFDGDVRHAQASGADAVLIKPCLPERLESEIRRLMRRSTEMAERIRTLRQKSSEQLARANELVDLSRTARRNRALSRAFDRRCTTQPPLAPPPLTCAPSAISN
jgi:CheY-like chemotaxis protein